MEKQEATRIPAPSKQDESKSRVCHYHTLTSKMGNAEEILSADNVDRRPQVGRQKAPAHPCTLANGLLTALQASRESQ